MTRLIHIEWLKLKSYRPFWVLVGLYFLCVTLVCCGGRIFLRFLEKQGAIYHGVGPTIIPIYDFSDVWQNMGFVASIFKVFLGIVMIISVSNEIGFRTIRQNVIDGLSKREFYTSKVLVSFLLAVISTLWLLLLGVTMASLYSTVGLDHMFSSIEFLFAHFLAVFTYLLFAMMIIILIRRPGLVIAGLFMYTFVLEPVAGLIIQEAPHKQDWMRPIPAFMPITSMNNLIPFPFLRYAFQEIQDYMTIKAVLIASGWLLLSGFLGYRLIARKDW